MANPKSKVLPQIVNVYLFVLVAYSADVFVEIFQGDKTIFGTNLYGSVVAIICIFIACVLNKKDIKAYGFNLKPKRILKGLYKGAIFSLVPTAIVAGIFSLIYAAFDVEWAKVSFAPPNIDCSNGVGIPKATLVYALTLIVSVYMKEQFFRGYAMRSARPVYQFFDANLIQAFLYVPLPLINHFRDIFFIKKDETLPPISLLIAIAVFYLIHEFLTAIKWGLLVRVSKDLWLVFFDHYFYNLIAFSLFFSQSKITNYGIMVKLLLVQLISFAMVWFYYKKKRAKKEKMRLQKELSDIEGRQKIERGEEHFKGADKINEKNAKANEDLLESFSHEDLQKKINSFSDANLYRHRHISSTPEDYKDENLVDLRDINVNDFYREYAKEKERRTQSDKESVSKQINSTTDSE